MSEHNSLLCGGELHDNLISIPVPPDSLWGSCEYAPYMVCICCGAYLVWCVFGVVCIWYGVGEHLHCCLLLLLLHTDIQCVMLMMCVPLTLKLYMVYVSSFLGPHPPSHMQLEAGDRSLGTRLYLWTAYYITVSVLFICCHRNWWKELWSRHSLVWCLMWSRLILCHVNATV